MTASKPFEIRGWHVLTALLLFFGVVIAINVAFAVMAVRSFPGEDVRRSYTQGIQYNDILAERRAQAALGWRASAELVDTNGGPALEVTLHSRDGAPLSGMDVAGALQWPTDSRLDRALSFEEVAAGRYRARVENLQAGRWRLRARAEKDAGALDFETELRWP
jgi:nitrogen fixation protein FixH